MYLRHCSLVELSLLTDTAHEFLGGRAKVAHLRGGDGTSGSCGKLLEALQLVCLVTIYGHQLSIPAPPPCSLLHTQLFRDTTSHSVQAGKSQHKACLIPKMQPALWLGRQPSKAHMCIKLANSSGACVDNFCAEGAWGAPSAAVRIAVATSGKAWERSSQLREKTHTLPFFRRWICREDSPGCQIMRSASGSVCMRDRDARRGMPEP